MAGMIRRDRAAMWECRRHSILLKHIEPLLRDAAQHQARQLAIGKVTEMATLAKAFHGRIDEDDIARDQSRLVTMPTG